MINGSVAMSITPTGKKPINHCIHEISICAVFFTSSTASKLGASAVRNIELVTQVAASAVHIKYDPILREVSPGSEPYRPGMLRITGKMVPPLRAVFDGVNGARMRSARVT